jgi:hypothetical protein
MRGAQRTVQVPAQILRILQANAQPEEAVAGELSIAPQVLGVQLERGALKIGGSQCRMRLRDSPKDAANRNTLRCGSFGDAESWETDDIHEILGVSLKKLSST